MSTQISNRLQNHLDTTTTQGDINIELENIRNYWNKNKIEEMEWLTNMERGNKKIKIMKIA